MNNYYYQRTSSFRTLFKIILFCSCLTGVATFSSNRSFLPNTTRKQQQQQQQEQKQKRQQQQSTERPSKTLLWAQKTPRPQHEQSNNDESFKHTEKQSWSQQLHRACRNILLGTTTAAATFFYTPDLLQTQVYSNNYHYQQIMNSVPKQAQQKEVTSRMNAFLFRPMSAFAVDEITSSKETSGPSKGAQSPAKAYSPVDEVWTLLDKYYIDRTFHGQDWMETYGKFHRRALSAGYDDDKEQMKLVKEMVQSLDDKYTRVLDAGAYARIQKYDLIGVGATLMPDEEKRLIVGAPPVPGSAAAQAGIQLGDFVTAVNGIPTSGRTAFDIIDQISENPNAKTITLTVRSVSSSSAAAAAEPENSTRDITLPREFQEVTDPVSYKISETRKDGTKVGYIYVAEFNSLVKAKLEGALADLKNQGANAFVLDMRGNGGGAFQSAVEIAGLFLDGRLATNVVDSNLVNLPFRTTSGKVVVDKDAPLAIWVDGGSASATEVLAGALHDNCRAIVMGERSFGKGLIQAVYGLKNGAGLVVTVAKYITPNGNEIQGTGITPDVSAKDSIRGPYFVPKLGSDTSKVDFKEVSKRLDPSMCPSPK